MITCQQTTQLTFPYCTAQPPTGGKLHSKCLEDHTALFLEPYSLSILFHSQNSLLSRSESPWPSRGLLSYLQSCTKHVPTTQTVNGCSLKAETVSWMLTGARHCALERLSTRMNDSWGLSAYELCSHGALNPTFPAPGWPGAFPHLFSENRNLMICSRCENI